MILFFDILSDTSSLLCHNQYGIFNRISYENSLTAVMCNKKDCLDSTIRDYFWNSNKFVWLKMKLGGDI